jgi:hypothetical protein
MTFLWGSGNRCYKFITMAYGAKTGMSELRGVICPTSQDFPNPSNKFTAAIVILTNYEHGHPMEYWSIGVLVFHYITLPKVKRRCFHPAAVYNSTRASEAPRLTSDQPSELCLMHLII